MSGLRTMSGYQNNYHSPCHFNCVCFSFGQLVAVRRRACTYTKSKEQKRTKKRHKIVEFRDKEDSIS